MVASVDFRTQWHKSSFSGAQVNCVEVAYGTWRKSSFSGQEVNCVEVAFGVGVRDSKKPEAGHLALPAGTYRAFVRFARTA